MHRGSGDATATHPSNFSSLPGNWLTGARSVAGALFKLICADLRLATSAGGRALALVALAALFAATTWLAVCTVLVLALMHVGVPPIYAMFALALLGAVLAVASVWWARSYLPHVSLMTSRRQIEHLLDPLPTADSTP